MQWYISNINDVALAVGIEERSIYHRGATRRMEDKTGVIF